jgi:SAM-dependent methyltransferase
VKLTPIQRSLLNAFEKRLREGSIELLAGCCVCGQRNGWIVARSERFGLPLDTVMCAACGTLRTDPFLPDTELASFYETIYQDLYGRALEPERYFLKQADYGRRLCAWIRRHLPEGAHIAEIGCGAGGALALMQDAGYRVSGCDYAAALVSYGESRGVPNLYQGGIDNLLHLASAGNQADLVFLHHVFEHLSDPGATLADARTLCGDRGVIVVAVPDVSRIESFRDKRDNMRLYLHVAHKFNYTLKGLNDLALRLGLTASVLDVETTANAPEMWVAFADRQLGVPASPAATIATGEQLFAHLRRCERRFLRREWWTRLGWHIRQAIR